MLTVGVPVSLDLIGGWTVSSEWRGFTADDIRAIQLDARKQGMTDAAEIAEKALPHSGADMDDDAWKVSGVRNAILSARDQLTTPAPEGREAKS